MKRIRQRETRTKATKGLAGAHLAYNENNFSKTNIDKRTAVTVIHGTTASFSNQEAICHISTSIVGLSCLLLHPEVQLNPTIEVENYPSKLILNPRGAYSLTSNR